MELRVAKVLAGHDLHGFCSRKETVSKATPLGRGDRTVSEAIRLTKLRNTGAHASEPGCNAGAHLQVEECERCVEDDLQDGVDGNEDGTELGVALRKHVPAQQAVVRADCFPLSTASETVPVELPLLPLSHATVIDLIVSSRTLVSSCTVPSAGLSGETTCSHIAPMSRSWHHAAYQRRTMAMQRARPTRMTPLR